MPPFVCVFFNFQIAKDEKDSILGSMPVDLREKGSVLYASLIDGKVSLNFHLHNENSSYMGSV